MSFKPRRCLAFGISNLKDGISWANCCYLLHPSLRILQIYFQTVILLIGHMCFANLLIIQKSTRDKLMPNINAYGCSFSTNSRSCLMPRLSTLRIIIQNGSMTIIPFRKSPNALSQSKLKSSLCAEMIAFPSTK